MLFFKSLPVTRRIRLLHIRGGHRPVSPPHGFRAFEPAENPEERCAREHGFSEFRLQHADR